MQHDIFDRTYIDGNELDWKMPTEFPRLSSAKILCIDLETCDPNLKESGPGFIRRDGHIAGIAVGTNDGYRGYFPFGHERGPSFDKETVLRWAREQLCTPGQLKVGANLPYDLGWLRSEGVIVPGPYHCTHITERLIDNNNWPSLQRLSEKYLGESKVNKRMNEWCARAFGGTVENQGGNIWRATANVVGPYAEGDVDLPLKILPKQLALIEQYKLSRIYDLEHRLIPMLMDMRFRGIRVDESRLDYLRDTMASRAEADQRELNKLAGFEISVEAANDCAKLFNKLGLPYGTTGKNQPSFTQDFLKGHEHPIARKIYDLRKWHTFAEVANKVTAHLLNGRVHTTINQNAARTGRMSSSNPNLNNIPSKDDELATVARSIFGPEPGEDWASMDYSQIEYRYLVHLGKGEAAERLKEAYRTDPTTDVHDIVAKWMDVGRSRGKNLNFGKVYGLGVTALANNLGWSIPDTKALIKKYDDAFPFAKELDYECRNFARKHGYIKTISGRMNRFDTWESSDFDTSKKNDPIANKAEAVAKWGSVVRAGVYKALNSKIQGSAADIMKKAMVDVYESGVCNVLGAPLLTVYDELDFSVPRTAEGEEALMETKRIMENVTKLSIPLLVDLERGPNWGEIK